MRPPYRRYAAIHQALRIGRATEQPSAVFDGYSFQACFHGEADVVRKFVEDETLLVLADLW